MAARKTERVAAVKAADSALPEEYFTEARAQRWAEMADEAFTSLVADLTEAASHRPVTKAAETAATEKDVRETAAFKGGDAPTAGTSTSLFGQFLSKTGTRRQPFEGGRPSTGLFEPRLNRRAFVGRHGSKASRSTSRSWLASI